MFYFLFENFLFHFPSKILIFKEKNHKIIELNIQGTIICSCFKINSKTPKKLQEKN